MSLVRFAAVWWLPLVLVLAGSARPAPASTWIRIGPEGSNVTALAEDTSSGRVYAATRYGGVYVSTDGGRTWQYSSDGISGCRRGTRTSIAFRPDDAKKMVFFFTDHGSALTTDGADTFTYAPPPYQPELGARTTPVGACDPRPGSRRSRRSQPPGAREVGSTR